MKIADMRKILATGMWDNVDERYDGCMKFKEWIMGTYEEDIQDCMEHFSMIADENDPQWQLNMDVREIDWDKVPDHVVIDMFAFIVCDYREVILEDDPKS